jgi:ABC-2 type transport system permease protein
VARRKIALAKLGAHLAMLAIAMLVLTGVLLLAGRAYATLPGDEIGVGPAVGYALLTAVMILIPGSIAWAAAPFVGRTPAVGLAVLAMLAAYLSNAFREAFPAFGAIAPLSWFAWTADHLPLAGHDDWPALAVPAVLIVGLLAFGIVAFERSDIGATVRLPSPHLPAALLGLRGPLGRGLAARLGVAMVWGLGVGAYVMLVVGSASDLARLMQAAPTLDQAMRLVYPDIDYATAGGMLQLIFIEFGLIVFGFAAATIVSGWASDEASGRLEVVLAAPISRIWWFLWSGLGTYLAIVLAAAIVAIAVGLASLGGSGNVLAPMGGAFVLALYGCAFAGVGFAVAGLFRSSLAAPVVAGLTVVSFLDTLFARPLHWPDWVTQLALSTHYGHPMVGSWDPVGVAVSVIVATGGLVAGAWGFSGRDVRT